MCTLLIHWDGDDAHGGRDCHWDGVLWGIWIWVTDSMLCLGWWSRCIDKVERVWGIVRAVWRKWGGFAVIVQSNCCNISERNSIPAVNHGAAVLAPCFQDWLTMKRVENLRFWNIGARLEMRKFRKFGKLKGRWSMDVGRTWRHEEEREGGINAEASIGSGVTIAIGVFSGTWQGLDRKGCSELLIFVYVCRIAEFDPGDIENDGGVFICICVIWSCHDWLMTGSTLRIEFSAICDSKRKLVTGVESWFFKRGHIFGPQRAVYE